MAEERVYRYKNPVMEFFCPLCSTARAFVSRPRLSAWNYLQIGIVSAFFILLLHPFVGIKSVVVSLLVWMGFEFAIRANFKKQIPCPHCGFDASWYKRDVKMARQKVQQFWNDKEKDEEQDKEKED